MRILVCGSRDLKDEPWVYSHLSEHIHPWDTVLTGGARGADKIAHGFAVGMGCETVQYPADWKRLGRAAGPIRNMRMLVDGKPDYVLAFPGGKGTTDMVTKAAYSGVKVVWALP